MMGFVRPLAHSVVTQPPSPAVVVDSNDSWRKQTRSDRYMGKQAPGSRSFKPWMHPSINASIHRLALLHVRAEQSSADITRCDSALVRILLPRAIQ